MKDLCDLIAKEQDQTRFSVLIHELNQLLDGLHPAGATDGRTGLSSPNEKMS